MALANRGLCLILLCYGEDTPRGEVDGPPTAECTVRRRVVDQTSGNFHGSRRSRSRKRLSSAS